jgi:lipopolysaccharide export system permease protein
MSRPISNRPVHRTFSRRPGPTLYAYVAWETLLPFSFALAGLTLAVLTTDLIGFSELVINRGIGAFEVGLIALYKAAPVAAFIFPFALLVALLVALGRLGADREILVLEASGVSAVRLIPPILTLSAAAMLVSAGLSLFAAPAANRALDASLERISAQQPWAVFRAGSVNEFGGWQVEAREVSAKGDELRGVLLWMPSLGETVFARRGQVATAADGSIEITLREGSLVLLQEQGAQQLRFSSLVTRLPRSDRPVVRAPEDRLRGWTLRELLASAREFTPSEAETISPAWVEFHRRLSIPVATLVFGFLAVPLLLTRRSFSRSGGGVLGVLVTIVYFALVQLGEGLV